MQTERQQLKVAETVAQKKPQSQGFLYEFLNQFSAPDPDAPDPYKDYPNGFVFLVLIALMIFFVTFFYTY